MTQSGTRHSSISRLASKPVSRRQVLAGGAAGLASGLLPRIGYSQAKTTTLNLQLGWIAGGNQIGEVVAKHLGYYEEEKLNLAIQPGGPSIDGVAVVASGRFEIGQVSSSPSLMLAASQSIPVQCFAVGAQEHPYTFFSLKKKPITSAKDMIGKKVGIQATGRPLLSGLLRKNGIQESQVEVVIVGADMTPLMTGQVDAFAGWQTNTSALRVLGNERVDLRLWDNGVKLYALPYYATKETLDRKGDLMAGFVRATAKGWKYAYENPEKSVDFLIKEFPNLVKADEVEAAYIMVKFAFTGFTKENGWGAMDMGVWQSQIALYDELKQFSAGAPSLDKVATTAVLDATKDKRPKIG